MATDVKSSTDIRPGDFYEDCSYHPCLCIRVDDDEVSGISLVDGTSPRSCSIFGCGIVRLSLDEAVDRKFYGPPGVELPQDKRWWVADIGTARLYRPRPHNAQ
jgi:hypothetical protein